MSVMTDTRACVSVLTLTCVCVGTAALSKFARLARSVAKNRGILMRQSSLSNSSSLNNDPANKSSPLVVVRTYAVALCHCQCRYSAVSLIYKATLSRQAIGSGHSRATLRSEPTTRQVEIHRKGPAKTPGGILGEKCKNHLFYTIWVC